MHRPSAAFRLAAIYSFVLAAAALALGTFLYGAMRADLRLELDRRIVAERDGLLRESKLRREPVAAAVAARQRHGGEDMIYALLVDGRTVQGPTISEPVGPGWAEMDVMEAPGHADRVRALITPVQDNGLLVVGADPESIERLDDRITPLLASVLGLMAVMGIGGGLALSMALRRRLDGITDAAEAIISGDLTRRMPLSAKADEFDRLSATLNRMLDRIDALMTNLRQVSGDIAHDLRTPLTRLRQRLDLAAAGNPDRAALRQAIEEASAHADELLALFTAILAISEVESEGAGLKLKPFDLSALMADIAESYALATEDEGRRLQCEIAPGIVIDGQRELIAQLIVNLLDNALRHTPQGTTIELDLCATDGLARIIVADNGPGIPAADRTRVFERFVRLEGSRTTPGHGLGLRMVAAIAAAHGAAISLQDNNPGVRMMIDLKRSGA